MWYFVVQWSLLHYRFVLRQKQRAFFFVLSKLLDAQMCSAHCACFVNTSFGASDVCVQKIVEYSRVQMVPAIAVSSSSGLMICSRLANNIILSGRRTFLYNFFRTMQFRINSSGAHHSFFINSYKIFRGILRSLFWKFGHFKAKVLQSKHTPWLIFKGQRSYSKRLIFLQIWALMTLSMALIFRQVKLNVFVSVLHWISTQKVSKFLFKMMNHFSHVWPCQNCKPWPVSTLRIWVFADPHYFPKNMSTKTALSISH